LYFGLQEINLSSAQIKVFILLFFLSLPVHAFSKINIVTEVFNPFQTQQSDGQISGWSTDIVRQVLQSTNIDYEINVLPWARAYQTVMYQPETLIFSFLRTKDRKDNFNWLIPLCTVEIAFYTIKSNHKISINNLAEAKTYRIGVERDQAKKEFLVKHGLTKNIIEVDNNQQLREMMKYQRVDIIIASKDYINADQNINNFKHLFTIKELNRTLYLASYKDTANADIDKKITTAYQLQKNNIQRQCVFSGS